MANTAKPKAKAFWKSSGFWGIAISATGKLLSLFGVDVTEDQTVEVTNAILVLTSFGGSLVGDVLALFGRSKADTKLGLKDR